MLRTTKHLVRTTAAVGATVLAATALAPSAAQAYGNLTYRYVKITNTSTCAASSGQAYVSKVSGGCHARDAADGTFFKHDAGGHPVKLEIHSEGTLRAKAEFHPNGEQLWVYDTSNDGEMIYFELRDRYTDAFLGLFYPAGTSKKLDFRMYDLSFAEGRDVSLIAFEKQRGGRGTGRLTQVVGRA